VTTILDHARRYVAAGLSVIPVWADGSKAPKIPAWTRYGDSPPTEVELVEWFGRGAPGGIGIPGGPASGNLSVLDFETAEIWGAWLSRLTDEERAHVGRCPLARTPRGGAHLYVRLPMPTRGLVLAEEPNGTDARGRAKRKTLIETRAHGEQVLAPGCPPECHPLGLPYTWEREAWVGGGGSHVVPLETWVAWLEHAEALTRVERKPADRRPDGRDLRTVTADDPGTDFNFRGTWAETGLFSAGWEWHRDFGDDRGLVRRPDKGRGVSGSLGLVSSSENRWPLFHCFSTNAGPFEGGGNYDRFGTFARLEHGGDFKAAARTLRVAVTLLSALWKIGKTTLLSHLLAACSGGGDFLGKPLRPTKVLYVSEEGERHWVRRRDALALADNVGFYLQPFPTRPATDGWLGFVDQLEKDTREFGFDLVVFDTLAKLWPVQEENDAGAVDAALMPLWKICKAGAGVLLIHHLRKSGGGEYTGSRGSGALSAFPDILVELVRYDASDAKCKKRKLRAKGRYEETPDELVIELINGQYVAVEGVTVGPSPSPPSAAPEPAPVCPDGLCDEERRVLTILVEAGEKGITPGGIQKALTNEGCGIRRDKVPDYLSTLYHRNLVTFSGLGKKGNPQVWFAKFGSAPGCQREPNSGTELSQPPEFGSRNSVPADTQGRNRIPPDHPTGQNGTQHEAE
jgi:hypothetical protein